MTTAKQQQQIAWRRSQVLELASKGHNQSDIARILRVDKSVICRDMTALNQQSQENIKKYVDEKLPNEYEKCLVGLTAILKEAWNTSEQALDHREKIQALALAKDCYTTKLELLTNAIVVDDAIRFVSEHNNHEKPEKRCGERKQDSNGNMQDEQDINTINTINHVF